ncbi:MAG TPA: LysM peptidoglycan-binding domain-containing protein, partial [Polyangiaceae bacterium]
MQSCRHTQSRRARWLKVAVSVAVGAIAPGARAQQGPPASDEQPVSPPVPAQGGGVVFTPPQVTTTHVYVPPPGYPQPGTDINPGLPSSSRPVSGDQRDSFDLLPTTRGTPVLQGDKGATGVVSSRLQKGERATAVPEVHIVNRGDTLWDLSARYYQNPYYWPKVWSYNPQLQNPHWIYPGDQLRMLG